MRRGLDDTLISGAKTDGMTGASSDQRPRDCWQDHLGSWEDQHIGRCYVWTIQIGNLFAKIRRTSIRRVLERVVVVQINEVNVPVVLRKLQKFRRRQRLCEGVG